MTTTKQLDEKQYTLIHQYTEMLQTVEEAFEYVESSFDDYSKTEGDLVLSDIFAALGQIESSNQLLRELFQDENEVLITLEKFDVVPNQALKLEGNFNDQNVKEKVIKESLSPAFSAWKMEVEKVIKPFIRN
jgi:hypothetical protein